MDKPIKFPRIAIICISISTATLPAHTQTNPNIYNIKEKKQLSNQIPEVKLGNGKGVFIVPKGDKGVVINRITVDGHGIIDFSSSNNNSLYVDEIIFKNDSWVTLMGITYSIMWIRDNGQDMDELIRHLAFDVRGTSWNTSYYKINNNGYYYISFTNTPWHPVPEAAVYSSVFSASALGLGLAYRKRRQYLHLPVPVKV
ncbi:hypothetical protein [Cephaloticoccus primus]|uniref:hypothetical protein n=1 Tax=Cephaloticoccus primus TaxID=1548207 RepID=UPI0012E853DC|nr:hypothetical protein [Cephaloticoccus primus]